MDIKEIKDQNIKRMNELLDLRTKQFQELYKEKWWEKLIKDEFYKFLIQKLVEIKQLGTQTGTSIAVTNEDIKELAAQIISPEEFMEDK